MEIDLQNLPDEIKAVLGDMPKVFDKIYGLSVKLDEKEGSEREFTFIMPDGVKIPFRSTIDIIKSLPKGEIEFELLDPDEGDKRRTILYLAQISKSQTMTGTVAINYAITIASVLGASSINLVDAAYVKCKDTPNTFPLSVYRVLTTESMGWYTNIAKTRQIPVNMNIPETYKFQEIIHRLKAIPVGELLDYYKGAHRIIRTSGRIYRIFHKISLKKGLIPEKAFPMEADKSLPILQEVIEALEKIHDVNFIDFLKNPEAPCKDKSIILRSLPGFSSSEHYPEGIINKEKQLIIAHPYLNEFLRLRYILQNTTLKLKGGSRRKTKKLHHIKKTKQLPM